MRLFFQLAARILLTRKLKKRRIICGNLNLVQAGWKGDAENASGFQEMVSKVFWDNGYTQRVSGPSGEDAFLDIHLIRLEGSFISCNIFPVISDRNGSLLEVEWDENIWRQK
jgi:hypothetical protein